MKVNAIRFEGEFPHEIDVTMTLDEAILITDYVGKLLPITEASSDIWDVLVSMVFNRYWEDGLAGAKRGDPA